MRKIDLIFTVAWVIGGILAFFSIIPVKIYLLVWVAYLAVHAAITIYGGPKS